MAEKKERKKVQPVKLEDRQKALDAALSHIEKQFGKGAVMKLGDDSERMNVEVTPTGSLSLDIALGVGGIPKGRIIEVFGPESSGKTTVALHMVAEVQKSGGIAGYIDAEHAMDPVYAKALGVDIDNLYISQPDDGEQALDIAETMVRSGAIDLVIVDSVAALVPRAEIEGEMGDSHVGLQARLMSQALRKLAGIVNRSKCTVLFINQLREKIGVTFGSPETTTGGRALKFYASVRIDIRKGEPIKQGTDVVGARTKLKIAKNKVAPPFKTAEFDIMYGQGISKEADILDLAAEVDIVNKSGAWYSYKETRIGQGRENAKTFLKEHPEMCLEIENLVRAHYGLKDRGSQGATTSDNATTQEPTDKTPAKKATAKASAKTSAKTSAKEDVIEVVTIEESPVEEVPIESEEMILPEELTLVDDDE
ncbi:MAG: recombinase RecA [Epulopiscium sp.]|nr:recombinase RecA [Candidatus Epulonipiscium sp.]